MAKQQFGCMGLFAAVTNPYKVKPMVSGAMWVSESGAGTGGSVRPRGLGFGVVFKGPLSCFGYMYVSLETPEYHQMGAPKRRPQREAAPRERSSQREAPQIGAPKVESPKKEIPKRSPQN